MGVRGGKKLIERLERIGSMARGGVRVGFLSGARYPDGTSVAQVALWNEFGTATSPARPFFRSMILQEKSGWGALMAGAYRYYNGNTEQAMRLVGEKISEQLQQSIVGWMTPANAPSTIAKKGFDKPLTDTKHMQDSIGFEIVGGDE